MYGFEMCVSVWSYPYVKMNKIKDKDDWENVRRCLKTVSQKKNTMNVAVLH